MPSLARDTDSSVEEEFDSTPLDPDELLEEMIRSLVDHHDKVKVRCTDTKPESYTLVIEVAESDRGKVIGREGFIITAIRRFFAHVGATKQRKVFIHLVDSENRPRKGSRYKGQGYRRAPDSQPAE